MSLRQNVDGQWVMPRGLSAHDMAHEIFDAVQEQDFDLPPDTPPRTLSTVRQYVKVTRNGSTRKSSLSAVR